MLCVVDGWASGMAAQHKAGWAPPTHRSQLTIYSHTSMSARWPAVAWDNRGPFFGARVAHPSVSSFMSWWLWVPKSTTRGQASLCKHFFKAQFAMQGKSHGQAQF